MGKRGCRGRGRHNDAITPHAADRNNRKNGARITIVGSAITQLHHTMTLHTIYLGQPLHPGTSKRRVKEGGKGGRQERGKEGSARRGGSIKEAPIQANHMLRELPKNIHPASIVQVSLHESYIPSLGGGGHKLKRQPSKIDTFKKKVAKPRWIHGSIIG